jgi:hypothetical protein
MNNTGLEKVAVPCSAETFVLDQRFVFSFDICGENLHFRQTETVNKTLSNTGINQKIYRFTSKALTTLPRNYSTPIITKASVKPLSFNKT